MTRKPSPRSTRIDSGSAARAWMPVTRANAIPANVFRKGGVGGMRSVALSAPEGRQLIARGVSPWTTVGMRGRPTVAQETDAPFGQYGLQSPVQRLSHL